MQKRWMAAALGGLLLSGCFGRPPAQTELLVLAAASLTDVMGELGAAYEAENAGVRLTFSFGASGALQTQLAQGAPADLFLSAAPKQLQALQEQGLLATDSPRELLENKLVLVVPSDRAGGVTDFSSAAAAGKIALGEPSAVPVGQYAEQVFASLGVLEQVRARAVYASDVRQVLTWVATGEADCGVVYATDAAASDRVRIVCEAPAGSCDRVIYPAAVLKNSKNQLQAEAFLDFLSTDQAVEIFESHGFVVCKSSKGGR